MRLYHHAIFVISLYMVAAMIKRLVFAMSDLKILNKMCERRGVGRGCKRNCLVSNSQIGII